MNKVIIALLFGSASAYPVPRPIAFLLDEYDINEQDAPHMITDQWVNSMSQHRQYVRKHPNAYFGAQAPGDTFFNTRYGDIPDEVDTHHDDEPIVMGQATLSSGSDSSDSEDENDRDAHIGALEEANRLGQVHRHGVSYHQMRRFDDQEIQLRFVNPEDSLKDDDYAEQVAQLRDGGDKELKAFRTRQEVAEEKKQQLLAQSAVKTKKFSDDLAEANAILKDEPVATPQKETYFAQKKNDALIDGMLAAREFADEDTTF